MLLYKCSTADEPARIQAFQQVRMIYELYVSILKQLYAQFFGLNCHVESKLKFSGEKSHNEEMLLGFCLHVLMLWLIMVYR